MNELTLDEIKKIEVGILDDVARVCDAHSIRYYLAGGTLLGAIRHKGFIPWDDDIDLIMPRSDYTHFLKIYPAEADPRFRLTSPLNRDCIYTYAKVRDLRTVKIEHGFDEKLIRDGGIEIDIFPMDGVPLDKKRSDRYFQVQKNLFKFYSLSVSKDEGMGSGTGAGTGFKAWRIRAGRTACRMLGHRFFIRLVNRYAMSHDFDSSDYVAASCVPYYGSRERVSKMNYIPRIDVEFEGKAYAAPAGYDEYLGNLYGQYMKLPPVEKRVTHHDYQAYWKE